MQQLTVPSSLKWFEWLALVGFITSSGLYLEHLQSRQTVGVLDVVGVIIGFSFAAGLVFLISRKGKQWAKWILIFVIVSSAMMFAGNLENSARNNALIFTINMARHFVMLVAMALLFTSDAKNYFAAKVK
ncbi:MAG: hypothetical protein ABL936_03630 [Aestuariivirga sp.]